MAELTKRAAKQLRSHLSSLPSEELVEVLLVQAPREDDRRRTKGNTQVGSTICGSGGSS